MICYKLICKSSEMIKNVDGLKSRFGRVLSCLKVVFTGSKFWDGCPVGGSTLHNSVSVFESSTEREMLSRCMLENCRCLTISDRK